MAHQTKETCNYPGCTIPLPHRQGHRPVKYCHTHRYRNTWTHQTAYGVLPIAILNELAAEAV